MNVFARTSMTSVCLALALAGSAMGQQNIPAPRPNPAPTQAPASGTKPDAAPKPDEAAPADDRTAKGEAARDERTTSAESRYPRLEAGDVDAMIAAWDPRAQAAAKAVRAKYGEPNEMTSRKLYWYESGPWLWTCVRNDAVMHNWPRAHAGVIEQAVALRVTTDRIGEIAKFNGAVMVDRNAGLMYSRGDSEEANYLAINLAQQISAGKRDAESARREAERISLSSGEPSPLMERFTFTPAAAGSGGDPDREVGSSASPTAAGATPTPATPVTASPMPLDRPRVPDEDKKKPK